jgi:hypothetical protein
VSSLLDTADTFISHTFPFVIAGMREIKPDTGGLTQLEWSWHVAHK